MVHVVYFIALINFQAQYDFRLSVQVYAIQSGKITENYNS